MASETLAAGTEVSGGSAGQGDAGELRRGDMVGRFLVVAQVGRGAHGRVYAAYDADLDRKVAIKLIAGPTSDERRRMLLGEAQALAKVRHPNVVAIFDVGMHEGQLFLAMEFVDGQTLRSWCTARDRSWSEVLDVLLQAGRGIAAAHACGVIHGDVKPDNVLVEADGVRVVDFGLARSVRGERPAGARAAGTPAYMAPELWSGREPDAASDQFAFGVMVFEALWGARPFRADSIAELAASIVDGRIQEPASTAGPRRIHELVRVALAVDPTQRHASLDALLDALSSARRRTWPRLARGAGLAAAALGVWFAARTGGGEASECASGASRIDAVWNAEQRAGLRLSSPEVNEVFAQAATERLRVALDRHANAWAKAYDELCPTIRIARADDPVAAARGACMESRLDALAGLVEFVRSRDVSPLDSAKLLETLPPVDECAATDVVFLAPVVRDPAIASEVAEIGRIVDGLMREMTSDEPAAADTLDALVARARATEHSRTLARALTTRARAHALRGDLSTAEGDFHEALTVSIAGGDDAATVNVVTGYLLNHRPVLSGDPSTWYAIAKGVLARLGNPPGPLGALQFRWGQILTRDRSYEDALAAYEASVAAHSGLPDRADDLARTKTVLGLAYARIGRMKDAARILAEVKRAVDDGSGVEPPPLLYIALSHVATSVGDRVSAALYNEQALELALRIYAPGTAGRSNALFNAALNDIGEGNLDRAEARLAASRAAWPHPDDPGAQAEFHHADASLELRRGRYELALQHAERVHLAYRDTRNFAPLRVPAWHIMVRALERLGRYGEALDRSEEAFAVALSDANGAREIRRIAFSAITAARAVGDPARACLWLARLEIVPPAEPGEALVHDAAHVFFRDRSDPAAVAAAEALVARAQQISSDSYAVIVDLRLWLAGELP
jgi:tetratricopeptide (TPR) repeat protein/predicted Ser/Thr protein kinase